MQVIKLNIIPDGIYPRVCVNQYDIGRQFQILFYEDISRYYMPNGVTFKINGRKADNHVFEYTESDKYDDSHYVITKSGSGTSFQIVISTTEQMTAAAGDAEVQLTLKDSTNRVIGTLNFILAVQERPASVGDPSESDLPDVVRSVNGIGPDADGDVVIGAGAFGIGAGNISSVEATRTMTSSHAAGSYVYVAADDQRYQVGENALNAGSTLTPGTNATARKVDQDVEQLNSDITVLSQTQTGLTPSNCTIVGGGYTKLGNLVIVNIRFTLTDSAASISGFPAPALMGTGNILGAVAYDAVNEKTAGLYMTSGGSLIVPNAHGSTGSLLVSFAYPTS